MFVIINTTKSMGNLLSNVVNNQVCVAMHILEQVFWLRSTDGYLYTIIYSHTDYKKVPEYWIFL